MVNKTLFISVAICLIIHCYFIHSLKLQPLVNFEIGIIIVLYLYGLFTSFLNHGTKNESFKTLDRISMRFLFIINIILLCVLYRKHRNVSICLFVLLILSGLLYYGSKTYDEITIRNALHIGSHLSITFVNIFVLYLI